jgi:hypothetical protein
VRLEHRPPAKVARVEPLADGSMRVQVDDDPHQLLIVLHRATSARPDVSISVRSRLTEGGRFVPWQNVTGKVTSSGMWIDRGPVQLFFDVEGRIERRRLRLQGSVIVDTDLRH